MACLIIVSVWQYAGYMMLIYVAGFMSVPKSLKEAAQIDGCTSFQATVNIYHPTYESFICTVLVPYNYQMLHGI